MESHLFLFVGDGPQIPYPSSNGPSDPSYGDIIGMIHILKLLLEDSLSTPLSWKLKLNVH